MQNVAWNAMYKHMGNLRGHGSRASRPTPLRKTFDRSPIQLLPAVKASEVADERPGHAHEPERDDAHHHRVQRVLGADQSAVEERQRGRHQQDQAVAISIQAVSAASIIASPLKGTYGRGTREPGSFYAKR
jgi:hypothetical protein